MRNTLSALPSTSYSLPTGGIGRIPSDPVGYVTVQGTHASSYEANVAWALDKVELGYIFQYEVLGGRSRRGGFIIDFLVFTVPMSTPLWVNGDYWHGGKQSTIDRYQQALFASLMRGRINRPVIFWGSDSETKEAALSSVRRELKV